MSVQVCLSRWPFLPPVKADPIFAEAETYIPALVGRAPTRETDLPLRHGEMLTWDPEG